MNGNKITQQIQAILRFFMALFYLGTGIFLLFFADNFQIDKALRNIIGVTFLFYGSFRIYTASANIVRLFFTRDKEKD